jgi:hypothetical protein
MKLTSLPSSTSLIANPLSDHHEILNLPCASRYDRTEQPALRSTLLPSETGAAKLALAKGRGNVGSGGETA